MSWGIKDKELGLTQKQKDNYSLARAMSVLANPHNMSVRREAGFELDLSEQVCKRDNRETNGVIIPQEILDHEYRTNRPMPRSGHIMTDQMVRGLPPPSHVQKRAISLPERMRLQERTTLTAGTNATAGYLIDTELQSVVSVLVENTLALQNVPSYTVMGDPVYFPRQTGRVEAGWGNETHTAVESNPTYDRVSFTAKHLKCLVPITRTLLIQSQPDADDIIRGDISIGIAKGLDTAMLYGTGAANNQPTGVKDTTDIVSVTYAANQEHAKVLDVMSTVGVNNIPTRNIKWFTSWRFCHNMKIRQKLGEHSEVPILMDGMIEGVPVEVSSQIVGTSTQKAEGFYADWLEGALVLWSDLDVEVDPYSKLDQGIIRFVATIICDFAVTRPKAFARLGGA